MHSAFKHENLRGETPLRRAIRENKPEAVRILLTVVDSELLFEECLLKDTILQLAVKTYNTYVAPRDNEAALEIIKLIFKCLGTFELTRRLFFLDKVDEWNNNIMHVVCWSGNVNLLRNMKSLIETAIDSAYFINLLSLKNKRGWSCLFQAIYSDNEAVFDDLLIIDEDLVNVLDYHGNNFIHRAITLGKYHYLLKSAQGAKRRKL
jgi:hypothetical protein